MTLADLQATYRPRYNLGIRCGSWSHPRPGHGLVVVDIDVKSQDAACEAFELLGRAYLGPISEVRSGRPKPNTPVTSRQVAP